MKYLFLLLSLVLISCSEDDKILVTGDDGLLYVEGTKVPFTGVETGIVDKKYLEYEVVNGEKHGYFKVFDENKKLQTYGHISHNKYEGKWEYFYPDGKVESVGFFKNDRPSGEWKWFYPNGKLKEIGNYFEGEREGEWKYYFENGQLQLIRNFKEGQIISENKP